MKYMINIRTIVIGAILVILAVMLLSAVFLKSGEIAYAASVDTAKSFVGHSAASVVTNYGTPEGWQYVNGEDTNEISDAFWYYGRVVFHIHYDNTVNPEGTVVDAEVLK